MLKNLVGFTCVAIAVVVSAPAAAGNAPGAVGADGAPPLYACRSVGAQRYSVTADAGCSLVAPLSADWRLLSVGRDGAEARYLDVRNVARNGDTIAVWIVMVKPDSSGAVFNGIESLRQFDMKSHEVIDCARRQSASDDVQFIRNFRSTAEVVKASTRSNPAPRPLAPGSIIEQVAAAVCDGGHPRAALP
jgi:hypothetical protein